MGMMSKESLTRASALARAHSPYLARLLEIYPDLPPSLEINAPDALLKSLLADVQEEAATLSDSKAFMRCLRLAKGKVALLSALADIAETWPLEKVTATLTAFADTCLQLSIDHLLSRAALRNEITLPCPDSPSRESGIIVLGMGKLGAHELNYSSDIDLILFYERGILNYRGRQNEQHFMSRLAQDLVQLMQERTADGYVFRTDLRLRPDPASTPPAISTEGAHYYYESVGQNWERAAMIKARPVAGDRVAGNLFLERLSPFMWRRSLDFAALQDIHSIKRQMDTRSSRNIQLAGHNVKLGHGGIREIEFFVQIHQLIWGGRKPSLRTRGTCETLALLENAGLITHDAKETLGNAYTFLRTLEHRLQMVADQQTHELPKSQEALESVASFMGFDSLATFSEKLLPLLGEVHRIFSSSFRTSEELGDEGGNLVFTGVSHDPETLKTLSGMGFHHPEAISETVMGWHHGSRRCTRTKRARELLTELMPALLKHLSETADPDAAFRHFDQFLSRIPAGVQLFSLFAQNPHLLKLIADILGSAPVLAESLSKHPDLLESVLAGDFYGPLPAAESMEAELDETLRYLSGFEERMEGLRRFRQERQFQAGVQLLKGMIGAESSGLFLSRLAELCVTRALAAVEKEFIQNYGSISGGRFCILALGKLGSGEMTFDSDLDLVFVYDAPDLNAYSSGEKSYTAGVYYNRLTQRVHGALTTLGREGRLYEVDTRLRPSGAQGLSAVSMQAFHHYFDTLAWTFEFMALTRARPIAGNAALCDELNTLTRSFIDRPREPEALRQDVISMRERVEKEFPPKSPWDLKYARGGLMDIDFIAQYLLLKEAHTLPENEARSSEEVLRLLHSQGRLANELASTLITCNRILLQLQSILRLVSPGDFDSANAAPGLRKLLAEAAGADDFVQGEGLLKSIETHAYSYYKNILESPS